MRRLSIGCDHAGFELKPAVVKHLESRGIDVLDMGTESTGSVDYPDYAAKVAESILRGDAEFGILLCGTGLGMAISANRYHGIRAVTVTEPYSAKMARAHNNANVLTMGSRVVGRDLALMIIDTFLDTPFEGGRHCGRIEKIDRLNCENPVRERSRG